MSDLRYLRRPFPKLNRQMTPRMKEAQVRNTEAEAMTEKNRHVTNVHRKVVEKNITPQPVR